MRDLPRLVVLLSALLAGCTTMQERYTAAAAAASVPTRIPLQPYLKAQATLTATVSGQTGTFLFDTGEGVTSISPDFSRKIACRPWGRVTGFRMSGERVDARHCDNLQFTIANHQFLAPAVMILDIMELLGPEVPHVDGAIGLDVLAGQVVTIVPRKELIIETEASLARRVEGAKELSVRLVRDAEGLSLAVNGAVSTPAGTAWFELDTGNGGSNVISNHIAPHLGLPTDARTPVEAKFSLANGIPVVGPTRTRDLIMDGNLGAVFLNEWVLTLDLRKSRAWLAPLPTVR